MANTPIPASVLRRLAVTYDLDPRSIVREFREPGSVRGMAGERARRALREYLASSEGKRPTHRDV